MKAKTVFWGIVLSGILIVLGIKIWDYFYPNESSKEVGTEQITLSVESSEPVNKVQPISGWVYTHKEVRPDGSFTFWYVPNDYTKETEWFKISDLNVGYRLKADAVIEFQDLSDPQKITVVKHENVNTAGTTGLKYTQDQNGNFTVPFPESELQKLASESEAFRFRPMDNKSSMTGLKVSKVE